MRASSELVAQTALALAPATTISWEELTLDVAESAIHVGSHAAHGANTVSRKIVACVTDAVRAIESNPAAPTSLQTLASAAGLSAFQFLRAFRSLTGVTPHQFILRTRLRSAATRIADDDARIIDIALDTGFGDLSNFNHAFRAEFGTTPSAFRDRSRVNTVLASR